MEDPCMDVISALLSSLVSRFNLTSSHPTRPGRYSSELGPTSGYFSQSDSSTSPSRNEELSLGISSDAGAWESKLTAL